MTRPAAKAPAPRVVRARAADLTTLSQVITAAFADLPQSQWLIPDPAARTAILPRYFRLITEHALANGTVHTTSDRAAVALWLPADAAEPTDYPARLAAMTGPWAGRFEAFDATVDRHHPVDIPHQHLAILAVRPGRQGHGLGTALLRARHHQLDVAGGKAAYLEAATLRAVGLYERHGYALTSATPFRLPDDGPLMWPMLRPAIAQVRRTRQRDR